MSQEEIQIPKGWELKKIEDVVEKISNGTNEKQNTEHEGLPVTRIETISFSKVNLNRVRYIKNPSEQLIKNYQLQRGDILFSHINSEIHLGKTALFDLTDVVLHGTNLLLIRPNQDIISPKFLNYYFNFLRLSRFFISTGHKSVNQSSINQTKLKNLKIIFPENKITQKKIVQKLDSILKVFVEKKKEILSLIEQNKERVNLFEKNWASYVIDREIENHPQRKEWKMISLQEITNFIGDGMHSTPQYVDNSDFYFINGNNLRNGSIVITPNTKMVDEVEYQKYKLNLGKNTVLLSINGTIGNLSFYENEQVILGKSACYINCNDDLDPKFLFYLLQSNLIKNYFRSELTKTSIPNLSLKSVRTTIIPLPLISTQKKIIQKIKNAEEKFKEQKVQFENIKENYESKIKYINHIQSSILDSAFSGKLVN